MANHKSSLKRIRQEEKRRLHNRYYAKTMRNTVKNFVQLLTRQKLLQCIRAFRRCWTSLLRPISYTRTKPLTWSQNWLLTLANSLKQSLKLKDKIGRIFQSGLLSFYVFHKTQAIHIANVTSKKYAIPRSAENSARRIWSIHEGFRRESYMIRCW